MYRQKKTCYVILYRIYASNTLFYLETDDELPTGRQGRINILPGELLPNNQQFVDVTHHVASVDQDMNDEDFKFIDLTSDNLDDPVESLRNPDEKLFK